MQIVLNGILFCIILFLCVISYCLGFFIGYKKKEAEKPKIEPKPLTPEQELQVKQQRRHEDNFWNYNGSPQEKI